MKIRFPTWLAIGLLTFVLGGCSPESEQPTERKITPFPDLMQTSVTGSETGDGQMYCAPVSVSNSLKLLLNYRGDQKRMAKALAIKRFMSTSLENGTGTAGVLRGVQRYLNARSVQFSQLAYQGWRKHIAKYSAGGKVASYDFARRFVGDKKAGWLNIGWYRRHGEDYVRVGGHWVTLAGYETSEGRHLYINDPSPRAGSEAKTHRIALESIEAGRLLGKKKGLPRLASGHLLVADGLNISPKADVAIIDGIVGLKLQ